nr:carboxypeptidase-like regulatory domain-containing protein [uncultured Allomuricauda sp.]
MAVKKMKLSLLAIALCFLHFGYAQIQQEIKGVVLDAETGNPIPFVNIGVLSHNVGTVTDEDGTFHMLMENNVPSNESVQISSIGYTTKKIPLKVLIGPAYNKIDLDPDITALNEVVVSSKRSSKPVLVGYTYNSNKKLGYWKGNGSLGGEMVTKIRVNKKPRTLNRFRFVVRSNSSDSLLMRVNVYDGNTLVPKTKLNKTNIYHTIKTKAGEEVVELSQEGIFVQDDFLIGLELLKVYGNGEIGLVLGATDVPGTSYRRYASQGDWERFRGDAMTFSVDTSVLLEVDDVSTLRKEQALASLGDSFDNNPLERLTKIEPSVFKKVTGLVFIDGEPVPNVRVQISGEGKNTITDAYGRYNIMAKVGDEINFFHLGMEPISERIENSTITLNVSLFPKINKLENVEVSAERKFKRTEEQKLKDYNKDKGLMKSAFGILDKETATYNMEVVDFDDDWHATSTDLKVLLQQSFTNVTVVDDNYISGARSVIYLRGRTSVLNQQPAIYEVDGQIFTEIPDMLNVANIKRIAKLPGMAAVRRYGNVAAGGMFIINTRMSNFSPSEENVENPLLQKNNTYKGDALTKKAFEKSQPQYIAKFNGAPSYDAAVKIYGDYKKMYASFPYFYLDALDYFMENWKNTPIINNILSDAKPVLMSDDKFERALAFVFDKHEKFDEAMSLYEDIYKENPNESQSYMSLARSYVENNNHAKALNIYSRYMYLLDENFLVPDTNATNAVIVSDFESLIKKHGKSLNMEFPKDVDTSDDEEKTTRIVFEWNDPSSNFELQFVDENQKFFTWNNWGDLNMKTNMSYLGSKEFEILDTDTLHSEWLVNVTYKGNENLTPTYLKATVYKDYGFPSETKQIKVFRLGLKNINHELFKIAESQIK